MSTPTATIPNTSPNTQCQRSAGGCHSSPPMRRSSTMPYEEPIKRAGHTEKLSYQPRVQQGQSRRRRRRKILWFNPPFDASMTTKLGKVFLNILDRCFPVGHVLRRVFNRHTVQLWYRTMPNMNSIIAANNMKPGKVPGNLPDQLPRNKNCNCRGGSFNCPVESDSCRPVCPRNIRSCSNQCCPP